MTEEKIINSQEVDTGFRIPDGDYQASIDKHLARLSFVKITEEEFRVYSRAVLVVLTLKMVGVFFGKAKIQRSLHREIVDEILRTLAAKGKGLEMNTSGVDRCGGFLPTADYFRRFKELGGQIVTVGSDAHQAHRVGQYTFDACEILKDIFGYVCTFEDRKPIFHKL